MDNRNFNRKDNGFGRGGFAEFLDKQGIYIIMLICLALIGITAYFALGSGGGEEDQAQEPSPSIESAGAQQDQSLKEEIKRLQATPKPTATPTETPKATATPAPTKAPETVPDVASAAAAAPAKVAAATPTPQKPLMPIDGNIIRPYSPEEPVFYSTLNEWMVHMGIDIEAPDETDIISAMDGTIEAVENRADTGYTILIDNGGGVKTLYGNLASPDGVEVGQQINRGDVIGKVGRSATNTLSDPAHVHFEYTKDGKRVNPEEVCIWNVDNQ